MSITTKEIAKMANVSQSTVSRCLNNSPMISEETKRRILKIADEHGFQFNANARSLSSNKTYTVGVIFPKDFFDAGNALHNRSWQDELLEVLEQNELDVIVSFFRNRFTKQNNVKRLIMTKKIDGLIILESTLDDETIMLLEKSDIPFVFCKYLPPYYETKEVDFVYVDQYKGGYLATDHLIRLGHRNIMCISAVCEGGEFDQRTRGYQAALQDHGLPFNPKTLFFGDRNFTSGYEIIKENSSSLKEVSAVFAQNDLMALGALSAFKELGINVPDDIALIGFDNVEMCTYFSPHLSTIHQPAKEIANLTCKRLIELMKTKEQSLPKQSLSVQPYLVVRDSCGGNPHKL